MSEQANLRASLGLYRRLLRYVWPYRWIFGLAILGMAITSATEPAFAALMKPLLDGGFVKRDPDTMHYVPLLIVGLFILRGIATFIAEFSMNWVARRVIFDIRAAMFERLVHLPSAFFDSHPSGTLISKVIYDVEQVANASTSALSSIVKDTISIFGLFGWMLYLDWQLTILLIVLAPLVGYVIRSMSRRFRSVSHLIQRSMGDISHVVQEAIEGQRVIKTFEGQGAEMRRFAAVNNRNRQQAMKKVAVAASGVPLVQLFAASALAAVVYLAMRQTEITVGSFISYIAAMVLMLAPVRRLTQVNEPIQTGLAAAQSVFKFMDEAPEVDTGHIVRERVAGRVEFRNVGFRYATAQIDALHDVSFTVEPGQTVALVGASGSGKTTIAALLPRFYRVTQGEIRLDGHNIADYRLDNLRRHVAVVSQDTVLFDDSLRNNIAYARPQASDAEIAAVAEAANVLEFAQRMPEGLDTMIGENGVRLSGGQRQRLAIARALLKNAPILILDEATSSLDTASERHVQAAMTQLLRDRTTLVIAHRLSTVERADKIIVLDKGRIIEMGTHAQLLERAGAYARLHRMQFNEHAH